MMRILVAPDSFKGSLTAPQVAEAIARGVDQVCPECQIRRLPIADGGEGTLSALLAGTGGRSLPLTVRGPLGDNVTADLGTLPTGIAVVEMAQASGITLIPPERRNPLLASSYGTGQLIKEALEQGCREIIVTIGGSATVDGGLGMLAALGARFTDATGKELPPIGRSLPAVARIDLTHWDARLDDVILRIASDVTNPLCGHSGAAAVFGPQKGADPAMVEFLDAGLRHFAAITLQATGMDVLNLPGAGAAGGVGAALMAYLRGQMQSGVQVVLDTLQVDRLLPDCDLIITGEGRMDGQTTQGKAPVGIAQRGLVHGCRTIALVGSIAPGYEAVYERGIEAVFPIVNRPMTLAEAMEQAEELLQDTAARVTHALMRFWSP